MSSEIFTKSQKALAWQLLTLETEAKVRRRQTLADGSYQFTEIVRPTSPIDFPENDQEFALDAHRQNPALDLSPIYINLRNLPEWLYASIGKNMAALKLNRPADLCVGLPNAGLPLSMAYSKATGGTVKNLEILDKVMNKDQADFRIKTEIPEGRGETVVIIDDVITTAGTKLKAAKVLRAHGFEVHDILVGVNRAPADLSLLTEESLHVSSIFEIMPLMDFYLEKSIKVNHERYKAVRKYVHS